MKKMMVIGGLCAFAMGVSAAEFALPLGGWAPAVRERINEEGCRHD